MSTQLHPLHEISQRATSALVREIGVVDTIRFLSQFRPGAGNYVVDRDALFEGKSVTDIAAEIKAARKKGV
jgi:hypothetical protein